MPTPSSHSATESQSFAPSCPDEQSPSSPPTWHAPPPYPSTMDEQPHDVDVLAEGDEPTSRSTTMSPGPQLSGDHPTGEPDGMLPHPGDAEDAHKQPDTDDEMTTGDHDGLGENQIAGASLARRPHV